MIKEIEEYIMKNSHEVYGGSISYLAINAEQLMLFLVKLKNKYDPPQTP